jgi:phosphate transport system substrate-binding protein
MKSCCTRIAGWISVAAAAAALWAQPAFAENAALVRVGGTGMALAAMQQLGQNLTSIDRNVTVQVLPSLGTPGGLRALADGAIDVAIVGRPLTAKEREQGAREAICLVTPLLFASSHPSPPSVAKSDLPKIFARPDPTWPDGSPLKIVLRSRAGSENGYLTAAIPGMAEALEAAYRLPGVPVATTDQENADLASRISGSFVFITLLQIRGERLKLQTLSLDGVAPTLDNVAAKAYPLSVNVCMVIPAAPTPAAMKFIDYVKSGPGLALLRTLGADPMN